MNALVDTLKKNLIEADGLFWHDGENECPLPCTAHYEKADGEYFHESCYVFVNNGYEGMFDSLNESELDKADVTYDSNEKKYTVKLPKRTVTMQFFYIH